MKKFFSLYLVIILVFNCIFWDVNAKDIGKYADEIDIANDFICNVLDKTSYNKIIELYDTNDDVKYLFFNVEQDGYVIIDIENNLVVEGGSEENKYILKVDGKCYYNGPLLYYEKNDNNYIELHSQHLSDKEELAKSIEIFKQKINTNRMITEETLDIVSLADVEGTTTITGILPNYSYNPNGICGSTAAAMFLRYFDIYYNDNYVDTALETVGGETLIDELVPYIEGSEPGSTAADMDRGLQEYLDYRDVPHAIITTDYTNATFQARINSNKPVLIDLDNHPTYREHWVTAYGYNITQTTGTYVIVNDGWGNTGIYINPVYIGYIVY